MFHSSHLKRFARGLASPVAVVTLAALAVAGIGAASASAAATVTRDVSSNWSGYIASATEASTGGAVSFESVSGTWTQPVADCTATTFGSSSSAFWVGLGGDSETSNGLEQVGTEADCAATGAARYSAWYELVPAASVRVNLKVAGGDTISASVSVDGTKVTVQLKNVTRGTSFSKTLTMASPDTSSAEWIAEAPSICDAYGRCQQTTLTNFGTVKFSNATATSNGHTGTISDPAWTATAIQLAGQAGPGSFGRYSMQATAAEALPTALRNKGSAFSIRWKVGGTVAGAGGPDGYGPGYAYGV